MDEVDLADGETCVGINIDLNVGPLLSEAITTAYDNFENDVGDNEGAPLSLEPPPQRFSLRLASTAAATSPETTPTSPTFKKVMPGNIERQRRREKAKQRRKFKKLNTPVPMIPIFWKPKPCTIKRYAVIAFSKGKLDSHMLPASLWIGKRQSSIKSQPWTLSELLNLGFRVHEWDGSTPHALLDNEDRIIAVLAGKPADPTWDAAVSNASAAMLHARITGKRNSAFNKDPESHRRGNFTAIPAGVSYGGGQTQPGNLVLPPKKREIVDKVLKHNDIKRIAGHQNSNLGFFFPLIYDDYRSHLRRLYEHSPNLRPNFPNISVYPACTLNLGPCTLTLDHTDPGNVAYGLCAITAMGNFEPKKGGHIILFDLKLVIEFPPGATVLIPSSVFRHGNTPIVGEGAWRMSLTQYCAGGLFRWVQYGFRTAKSLILSPGGKELKKEIDGKPADRAARALAMFSTLESLAKDRERVFGKRATQG